VSSPAEIAAPAPRRDARRIALTIAGFAIAFRLFSAFLALLVNVVFPDYAPAPFTVWGTASPFWDAFARYDSGQYWQIARYGYTEGGMAYVAGGRSSIAFFPVYPLLMRYVGRAIGRSPADLYIGGLIVSWVAFAIALIAIYYLARLDLSRRRALRAVLLTAIFPFAFFFGAVYTEALFLAATAGAFYLFRTKRWLAGGLCGALATASRANGILMWPALAWIVWREAGRDRARAILGLLLVGAGIATYSLYIYRLTGNPFEWAATIERWGYYPGGSPISALFGLGRAVLTHPYAFLAGERMAPYDTLNAIAALGALIAVPFVWRRFGAAYGLFMAANLRLPLSSGQVEGMGRYVSVLFPLSIWLASLPSTTFTATTVVFAMLYTLCLALFTNIHPLF
jgi:Dolichyl-phosphate-mannose-protein mannosyltransferase